MSAYLDIMSAVLVMSVGIFTRLFMSMITIKAMRKNGKIVAFFPDQSDLFFPAIKTSARTTGTRRETLMSFVSTAISHTSGDIEYPAHTTCATSWILPPKNILLSIYPRLAVIVNIGYVTIATVERIVAPMITRSVSVSFSLLSGNTDEIARAADAPHIPVAPQLSIPNCLEIQNIFERNIQRYIVETTAPTSTIPVCQPSSARSENAILKPISATQNLKTFDAVHSIPVLHKVFLWINHRDIPSKRAMSITGILKL